MMISAKDVDLAMRLARELQFTARDAATTLSQLEAPTIKHDTVAAGVTCRALARTIVEDLFKDWVKDATDTATQTHLQNGDIVIGEPLLFSPESHKILTQLASAITGRKSIRPLRYVAEVVKIKDTIRLSREPDGTYVFRVIRISHKSK